MNIDADIDVPLKDPWASPPATPGPRPRHAAADRADRDPAESVACWPAPAGGTDLGGTDLGGTELGGTRLGGTETGPATIGDPGRAHAEVRPRLRLDPAQPPDTVADHGTAVSLEVRAASVRGLSHRDSGTPRQDAYGFALSADEQHLIVVVADGVSAGVLSHEAASFVGRRGPREVARHLDAGTPADQLPWPRSSRRSPPPSWPRAPAA